MPGKGVSFGKEAINFKRSIEKLSLQVYLNECLIFAGQRLWFVQFKFCISDFSRVFQHYQVCQVDYNIIFLTNKIEYFADL